MEILWCMEIITLSVYKIDCTLRCLEYICSVSSPLNKTPQALARPSRPLNREDTDKCTLTIT